ncbi:MAG TPA: efflux RND transporter periplasmic adaptor subunit [Rhodocyclaceae bacterium]|nr:efflux RND transporter periplasmic adaptor subunit [Rhodocyclaceae bacterium]
MDCVNTALAQESFQVSATAVASELARAFDCDHVVIGMTHGSACKLVAWSGVADLRQEFRLARMVAAAMDESVDQNATLRYPPEADDPPRITMMHADLASAGVGESLLTLPLVAQQRIVGAISFIRERKVPWPHEEITCLENIGTAVGPVLDLKLRSQDSAFARLRRDIRAFGQRLTTAGHYKTKLITAALLAALAAALLIPIDANVTAPAKLEGVIQRSVTAPVDSFIKEVFVRPGDTVTQGQLLLALADQELRNEQRRLKSALARFRSEHANSFAQQDRARMVEAQAHVDETSAQLALIEDQLARTQMTAPFEGLVIQGDLQQQIGAPVHRGDALMVLTPTNGFRIVLQVEDRDIKSIKAGMLGRLTLSAMPYEPLKVTIERVTPLARFVDGHNIFEVQAALEKSLPGLRPGLEGIAKISLERRPLAFVVGSRLLEWARFHLWTLFG